MTAPNRPNRFATGLSLSNKAENPCWAIAWSSFQVKRYEPKEIKRKVAITKKTAPTIFQVRSSRARDFQSIVSSFSALKAFMSDLAGFFSGLFFDFFFSLVAMAAKIISLPSKYYLKVVCRKLSKAKSMYYI